MMSVVLKLSYMILYVIFANTYKPLNWMQTNNIMKKIHAIKASICIFIFWIHLIEIKNFYSS
jgi:hypothetical protein